MCILPFEVCMEEPSDTYVAPCPLECASTPAATAEDAVLWTLHEAVFLSQNTQEVNTLIFEEPVRPEPLLRWILSVFRLSEVPSQCDLVGWVSDSAVESPPAPLHRGTPIRLERFRMLEVSSPAVKCRFEVMVRPRVHVETTHTTAENNDNDSADWGPMVALSQLSWWLGRSTQPQPETHNE